MSVQCFCQTDWLQAEVKIELPLNPSQLNCADITSILANILDQIPCERFKVSILKHAELHFNCHF